MKALVAYWSQTGNTEAMANDIATGLKEGGADVEVAAVGNFQGDVKAFDIVALGCPAMGAEELESDEFAPFYQDVKADLIGKKVAFFGTYGWGDGEWMRTWVAEAQEEGISIFGDEGFICQEDDNDCHKNSIEFGKNLV